MSVAYDEFGRYIVHKGNAWFWKKGEFDTSSLPWAYLALVNSPIFGALLGQICPPMQDRQFNLNNKYIGVIHLPNLYNATCVPVSLLDELARLGHSIAAGMLPDPDILDLATAGAYGLPLSRMRSALDPASTERAEVRFRQLASEWQEATAHLSNLRKIIRHHACCQIIDMKEPAIPFLLARLRREPDWAPALAEITGENPIQATAHGDIKEIAQAWLEWGRKHGYEV